MGSSKYRSNGWLRTAAQSILLGILCLPGQANAGAAAPWAKLVEAKPLATNASILVEAFGGPYRFEVWAGAQKLALDTSADLWRRQRLPSEGQGALFVLRPVSGGWPPKQKLQVRVLDRDGTEPRWSFDQRVGETPDNEAPTVSSSIFVGGQRTETRNIPIYGERTHRWVDFGRVDDAHSSRVLVKLKLARKGETRPRVYAHTVAPGARFSIPLPPKGHYEFWGATLVDTAGNATTIGRPPTPAVVPAEGKAPAKSSKGCAGGHPTWPGGLLVAIGLMRLFPGRSRFRRGG